MADTHFSALQGYKRRLDQQIDGQPVAPEDGDFYFDSLNNMWRVFYNGQWWAAQATTSTSTSTSTTTTSTSTTTTSTSSSTSTTTSTSTSTSTTTTL